MKNFLFLSLFILFFQCLKAQTGDEWYEFTRSEYAQGNWDKALKYAEQAASAYLQERNVAGYYKSREKMMLCFEEKQNTESAIQTMIQTRETILSRWGKVEEIAKCNTNIAYYYLDNPDKIKDALPLYKEALQLNQMIYGKNSDEAAFCLSNLQVCYRQMGDYENEVITAKSLLEINKKLKKPGELEYAKSFQYVGDALLNLSKFDEAISYYQEALKWISQTPDAALEKAHITNNMAMTYQGMGQYDLAIQQYHIAKNDYEKLEGSRSISIGLSYLNLSGVLTKTSEYYEALDYADKGLSIFQDDNAGQFPYEEAALIQNKAIILKKLGQVEESILLDLDGITKFEQIFGPNHPEVAVAKSNLGVTYALNGENDKALNIYFDALHHLEIAENQYKEDRYLLYNNIGDAYDKMGNFEQAFFYKRKELNGYRNLLGENHPKTAMAYSNIGNTHFEMLQYDSAIWYHQKALAIRMAVLGQANDETCATQMNIGLCYENKRNHQKALEYYYTSMNGYYNNLRKNYGKTMTLNRIAYTLNEMGEKELAMKTAQQAFKSNIYSFESEDFTQTPDPIDFIDYYELILTYTFKADIIVNDPKSDLNKLLIAYYSIEKCDQLLKISASKMQIERDRLNLSMALNQFAQVAVQVCEKLHQKTSDASYLEKAFYFMERSHGNQLLSSMIAAKAKNVAKIPTKLAIENKEIVSKINYLEQRLADEYMKENAANQAYIAKTKSELYVLYEKLESIETTIANTQPKYQAFIGKSKMATIADVQQLLLPHQVTVSMLLGDSVSYVMCISKKNVALLLLPKKADINRYMKAFMNQMRYRSKDFEKSTDLFYKEVWSHADTWIRNQNEISHLIIIPGAEMAYFPFEVLRINNKYLIEDYQISYHYSATLLAKPLQKPNTKGGAVAFAPIFEKKETNYILKSCERFIEGVNNADTTARFTDRYGQFIAPLPGTRKEVLAISQLFSDNKLLSKHFMEQEAKEEIIKSGQLEKYAIIHFATHGISNTQFPELSGLLLSQNSQSKEDGLLYSGEIYSLSITADLVTLSACETAMGKKIEGEGIRGLTSSFLYAGANSVVSSLWKVSDESTSELMIQFYQFLLSGKSKSEAMRDAKLNMIKNSEYQHPYYWAPFLVIGK